MPARPIEFRPLEEGDTSLKHLVFSSQEIRQTFEDLPYYAPAPSFELIQTGTKTIHDRLNDDSLDWSIISARGHRLAGLFAPIWVECGALGWLIWPVENVLDETGKKKATSRIMVSHFTRKADDAVIAPVFGYIDVADLTRPKFLEFWLNQRWNTVGRETIKPLVRFTVSKMLSKLLKEHGKLNGMPEEGIRKMTEGIAAENAATFMIGLYLGFTLVEQHGG